MNKKLSIKKNTDFSLKEYLSHNEGSQLYAKILPCFLSVKIDNKFFAITEER